MLPRTISLCQRQLGHGLDRGVGPSCSARNFLRCRYNSTASSPPSSSTSKTLEKVVAEEKTKEGDDELPFLPRPLGVFDQPTTYRKSWKENTLELMDQDVRLERRRHMYEFFSSLGKTNDSLSCAVSRKPLEVTIRTSTRRGSTAVRRG